MVTAYGNPLTGAEADEFANLDTRGIEDLLVGEDAASVYEAREGLKPSRAITDRVVLYHPDPRNPCSVYVVPTNRNDRRVALLHLMAKKVWRNGRLVQWNNPRPVVEPAELPFRCFVAGCQRAGGLPSRSELIKHVHARHADEAPLYKQIVDRLMEQVYRDIDPEAYAALGIEPPEEPEHPPARRGRTRAAAAEEAMA